MVLTRPDTADRILAALAARPGAALEDLAAETGATPLGVLACLPEAEVRALPGTRFVEVMEEITGWGPITLVVNTGDVVLEARGPLPHGKMGQGYYNLHGTPIGGHLRAEACEAIAFVTRALFGTPSRSVQFYSKSGACMFKIYLGRDANRQMLPDQVAAFERAAEIFAAPAAA
ncbi:heme utilization cystosolic carrier protein HutX [Phaeovulum vinaykumarii]|uniref:Heme utilization protein HuvX n=1 Tax=Phaeovulum vinaykumarii TaxID=407234 RepID=A0A1N7JLJ0_9RHOB|nr:heme utilization cystosolic carrier protein HutX [Phaeovulum vinaykumarii]SIS50126.1 heme utilization protein HuvX [Phaeovulum vinaykumarii]SOB90112.1 heme utilization protein HuvX [Phaeovulum vinaykumarii]